MNKYTKFGFAVRCVRYWRRLLRAQPQSVAAQVNHAHWRWILMQLRKGIDE